MPGASFHSFYWQTQVPEVPPAAGASGAGGYVPWQTSVTMGCVLLFLLLGG